MVDEKEEGAGELTETPVEAPPSAGERLRAAREKAGLEIEHVAAETRIPIRHLEAIEAGEYENLPSRTYAIGFARTFARAVSLDETEIANQVRDELADGRSRQSALAGGMEPGDPAKLPSSGLAWAGAAAALILAIGVYVFYNTFYGSGAGPASLISVGEEQPAEQVAAADTADNGGEAAQPVDPSGEVVLTALEEIWVRFYDQTYDEGGAPLFEGVMSEGDTFAVPAGANEPRLNTGRPDALAITIGDQSVPKLSEEPITVGDAQVSAAALLARADTSADAQTQVN